MLQVSMKRLYSLILVATLLSCSVASASPNNASPLLVDVKELVLSGVQGTGSDPAPLTLTNIGDTQMFRYAWKITGEHPEAFAVLGRPDFTLEPLGSKTVHVSFCPDKGQLGPLKAILTFTTSEGIPLQSVDLYGLSAEGVEGGREPGMSDILETVGLDIDVGWTGHSTHTKTERVGTEIETQRFKKANQGLVNLIPIARYSPDYLLPIGYYRFDGKTAKISPIGSLALQTPTSFQHNCVYPKFASGGPSFDPGNEAFGIFTSSPSHFAYSEDKANATFEPTRVTRAVRVFPAKNRNGTSMKNAYLICFEEATNGDYQDYVFLITNVIAVD